MELERALEIFEFALLNGVTTDALRRKYLRKAFDVHPDKQKNKDRSNSSHEEFVSLQNAYDFLLSQIETVALAAKEKEKTASILAVFERAMQGYNVENDLKDLGVYRPSDAFGVDLSIPFDGRLPVDTASDSDSEKIEPQEALRRAFANEGLDEEGNPLDGWARPPEVNLEDL